MTIQVLAASFHVRDLAEWVSEQRAAHGGGAGAELPLLLARDQRAAHFARAAAAALNLSFARVAADQPWPNGYQHGSDDPVPAGFWRDFAAGERGRSADLLAFGSPVAFGFEWRRSTAKGECPGSQQPVCLREAAHHSSKGMLLTTCP